MLEPKPTTLTGSYVQLEKLDETHRDILKGLSQDEKISTYSPALKLKFDSWFNKALKNYPESPQLSFIVRMTESGTFPLFLFFLKELLNA